MSIIIQHHEDARFSAHHGDHQVTIDLPESHGGEPRCRSNFMGSAVYPCVSNKVLSNILIFRPGNLSIHPEAA